MVFFGSLRAYWGKKNLDISFWEPAIPVEPEKRETFWKGKWVLKNESSLGEGGFLEKR